MTIDPTKPASSPTPDSAASLEASLPDSNDSTSSNSASAELATESAPEKLASDTVTADSPTADAKKPLSEEHNTQTAPTAEVATAESGTAASPETAKPTEGAAVVEDRVEPKPEQPKPEQPKPSGKIRIGTQRASHADKKPKAKSAIAPNIEAAAENKRKSFPPPNIREKLTPELEKELEDALGGQSLDSLIDAEAAASLVGELELDTRVQATVVKVLREDVLFDLGGKNQGIVSLRQFKENPEVGAKLELNVIRLNAEDGLYDLSLPGASVSIANWDDVQEGTVIEVTISGVNKGGLECTIAGIRAFIPMGQVSIYRVENAEEYIGQKLACVVTEARPEKRNLVLSHRAVMEREKAAAKEQLLKELAVGQTREGIVRNLREFGAFVDLGGVDGLIHISQLSWDHIKHPNEVLKENQTVKVRIEKIDPDTGKIGLSYRDLMENPWDEVESKYAIGTTAHGKVSKLMDFGAFVRLEAGIEGLIHISELSPRPRFPFERCR